MKEIPLYSLVIFPNHPQSDLVKSYKQLLKNKIGWFGSANAAAHITVIQFSNEMEFQLYIAQIREYCKSIVPQNVRLNSLGSFDQSGAFFIAPDEVSKSYLDNIIINIHEFLGFKIDKKNANAHMSIARQLHGDKMKVAFELFKTIAIDLQFNCDSIYVRKFNEQTKQYSDIVEKISFGKTL
ncbi:2'-5' RNA ligase family protein [Flavobacterium wongokense]|uniref:2'-5' RNA ligase family protein n=1 Tax=Flavobacterium wongokense TaxID=2910674 RepID=UPI001F388116|nr:2'-5' RNA ligase family protein [Flavobacterium sp. WG47]MCF6132458.1 2'-5' RNA ligase family protein [Flavobacterium sp. WG47]